jgi:hypothetical protein
MYYIFYIFHLVFEQHFIQKTSSVSYTLIEQPFPNH